MKFGKLKREESVDRDLLLQIVTDSLLPRLKFSVSHFDSKAMAQVVERADRMKEPEALIICQTGDDYLSVVGGYSASEGIVQKILVYNLEDRALHEFSGEVRIKPGYEDDDDEEDYEDDYDDEEDENEEE